MLAHAPENTASHLTEAGLLRRSRSYRRCWRSTSDDGSLIAAAKGVGAVLSSDGGRRLTGRGEWVAERGGWRSGQEATLTRRERGRRIRAAAGREVHPAGPGRGAGIPRHGRADHAVAAAAGRVRAGAGAVVPGRPVLRDRRLQRRAVRRRHAHLLIDVRCDRRSVRYWRGERHGGSDERQQRRPRRVSPGERPDPGRGAGSSAGRASGQVGRGVGPRRHLRVRRGAGRVPCRGPGDASRQPDRMSTIVLDTDVSSLIIKRQLPDRLAALLANRLLSITFVTVGELRYWVESRPMSRQRFADLTTWKRGVVKLPGDEETAEVWGQLTAAARLRGRPRPQNDTWIAASCISRGLPLATRNVRDFVDFAQHHGLVLVTD